MRILLVEDDPEIGRFLSRGLRESGHAVVLAADGQQGLLLARQESFDAIVLDRMLPGLDGLSLLASLRQQGQQTPVLILSALGDIDERIRGLRAGGDDYLVKPFAIAEVLARLDAITRRHASSSVGNNQLRVADLEMDRLTRKVSRAGTTIDLKPQEYRLLELLMRHAGHVVTRTMIFEAAWDYQFDPGTNVIDVHISRLRSKIDRNPWPALIHTFRGSGYCLRAPA